MKKLFFAIAFLTAAARLHSIPGDLNEDGKLNIADQVMLNAMIENRLAQTNAADLNFDDKVDNADMELLTAAVIYGKPLPQRLDSIYLNEYASDWSVSGGGLTLDIPGYCSRQRTVSLTTMPEPPDFDIDLQDNLMTPPVIVFGMQGEPLTEEAIFTLDVPPEHNDAAGKPMLLLGSPANSPHRKTTLWSYRVIPAEEEFGVTYTNRKLVGSLTYEIHTAMKQPPSPSPSSTGQPPQEPNRHHSQPAQTISLLRNWTISLGMVSIGRIISSLNFTPPPPRRRSGSLRRIWKKPTIKSVNRECRDCRTSPGNGPTPNASGSTSTRIPFNGMAGCPSVVKMEQTPTAMSPDGSAPLISMCRKEF